jgi:FixJ family two-component response regulator
MCQEGKNERESQETEPESISRDSLFPEEFHQQPLIRLWPIDTHESCFPLREAHGPPRFDKSVPFIGRSSRTMSWRQGEAAAPKRFNLSRNLPIERSAAADSGVKECVLADKILFVDDEPPALDGYRRILRQQFAISTANSGEEGLAAIQATGPYAVVISDMRMPGMSGSDFLAQVRRRAPDSVRMLLTGHADLDAAIDAVNRGNIFRFLTKPCEKPALLEAIHSGLEQYHAVIAEKELVKKAQLIAESKSGWDTQDIRPAETSVGPAGLPGPDEARSHLGPRLGSDAKCFVVLIKLGLLPTVEERYGEEAGLRYLKDAVKFLLQALHPGDRLFYWSHGVLMTVIERHISPAAVRMEVSRLLMESPQHLLEFNGRRTMIAISATFDLFPAARFTTFDELLAAFDAKLIGSI